MNRGRQEEMKQKKADDIRKEEGVIVWRKKSI